MDNEAKIDRENPESRRPPTGTFPATPWSELVQAGSAPGEANAAWETLARDYWQPLYFFLRRRGSDHHAAADDIQGFFAHLLDRDFLRRIERGNGLFRSFLLGALKNWRIDQFRAATAQRRGGGQLLLSLTELDSLERAPMAEDMTPEEAFDRRWARTLYDNALSALHTRMATRGRERQFLGLRGLLTGTGVPKYAEIAADLDMSEGAVKQCALEMRREFATLVREEIRRTVSDESQVDDEIRYLLELLRG